MKKVMRKQGRLVPLWALDDPCPCLWKVCLAGEAVHRVIHSFPLSKEPELTLQPVAPRGLPWPRWGHETCWKGLLQLSLQTVALELQVPPPL